MNGPGEIDLTLTIVITIAAAGLAAVAGIAAYLWWQSSIAAPPYDATFEVRESEPLRVDRTEDGWRIITSDAIRPISIHSGTSPTAMGSPLPVTAADGHYRVSAAHLPARRRYFVVALADGRSITTAERILPLEGAANFRDIGGYTTADGRRVAWGRVYRSDQLAHLTDDDLAFIQGLGVKLICDLRSYAELERFPDRLVPHVAYQHVPVYAREPFGQMQVLLSRHRLDALLARLYLTSIITQGAAGLGQALALVADPANLPLVLHCTGGKDRAGVASALLLHICGVARETIVADYTLTNLAAGRFLSTIGQALDSRRPLPGFRIEQLYPLLSARPQLIERVLTTIEARYGSLDAYLRGPAGLAEETIGTIRHNLVV